MKRAFSQVHGDDANYSPESHREGKVILLSKHGKEISDERILDAVQKGFLSAKHKGYITGKLEVWINGRIYKIN